MLGLLATARGRWLAAALLFALGVLFVGYSLTVKEWCKLHEHAWGGAWGETAFHGSLGECIKEKGWFSL